MIVYRLSKDRYANDLSGRGAELAGGRWNSKGVAMLYTSESIALCTVEVAVHMPLGLVPENYFLVRINIPNTIVSHELPVANMPENWKSYPHSSVTQSIGDQFVSEAKHLVLKAPSSAVQGTFNYLINPYHPDIRKIKIAGTEPFEFDRRLFIK
jgi:RES domain-containing protein